MKIKISLNVLRDSSDQQLTCFLANFYRCARDNCIDSISFEEMAKEEAIEQDKNNIKEWLMS